jgi:hypothetical protein
MPRTRYKGCLLAAFLVLLSTSCTPTEAETGDVAVSEKVRSVTLSARRPVDAATLDDIAALGATHVAIIPFGYQTSHDDPQLRFDPDTRWFTESDEGIRTLAAQSRDRGIGTILKPHIWIGRSSGSGLSRDRIDFSDESGWLEWEAAYRAFILHYARLATEVGSDVFVVGTELASAARQRPDFWHGLVRDVRKVFPGSITYAANWYEEYEDVSFWRVLDFIGVQGYFPVHNGANPSNEQLAAGWKKHRRSLRNLSRDTQRPLLFTEIGYRSVATAAKEPWTWANRDDVGKQLPDPALQARLYQAFFESLWDEPWFGGAVLWRWHAGPDLVRPIRDIDFTPQNKPSEAIIRQWFSR